jgi:hypothetical protein
LWPCVLGITLLMTGRPAGWLTPPAVTVGLAGLMYTGGPGAPGNAPKRGPMLVCSALNSSASVPICTTPARRGCGAEGRTSAFAARSTYLPPSGLYTAHCVTKSVHDRCSGGCALARASLRGSKLEGVQVLAPYARHLSTQVSGVEPGMRKDGVLACTRERWRQLSGTRPGSAGRATAFAGDGVACDAGTATFWGSSAAEKQCARAAARGGARGGSTPRNAESRPPLA